MNVDVESVVIFNVCSWMLTVSSYERHPCVHGCRVSSHNHVFMDVESVVIINVCSWMLYN